MMNLQTPGSNGQTNRSLLMILMMGLTACGRDHDRVAPPPSAASKTVTAAVKEVINAEQQCAG